MAKQITNAVLAEKIDHLTNIVQVHITKDEKRDAEMHVTIDGSNGTPGFKTRIDRLEQVESARKWHFRTSWAALLVFGSTVVSEWVWR
jgi:hypothetical protein